MELDNEEPATEHLTNEEIKKLRHYTATIYLYFNNLSPGHLPKRPPQGPYIENFVFSMLREIGIATMVKFSEKAKTEIQNHTISKIISATLAKPLPVPEKLHPGSQLPTDWGFFISNHLDANCVPTTLSRDIVPTVQDILDYYLQQNEHSRHVNILQINFFTSYWTRHNVSNVTGPLFQNSSDIEYIKTPGIRRYRNATPIKQEPVIEFKRIHSPVKCHPKADMLSKLICKLRNNKALPQCDYVENSTRFFDPATRKTGHLFSVSTCVPKMVFIDPIEHIDILENVHAMGFTVGELSSTTSELALFTKTPVTWGVNKIWSFHMGILGSDINKEALHEYIEAHMLSMRCSGIPTLNGFTRFMTCSTMPPPTTLITPVHYIGGTCVATNVPKKQKTTTDKNISVYMLGDLFQYYRDTHSPHEFHDSGKALASILNSLDTITTIVGEKGIRGVSSCTVSDTIHAKLSYLCGPLGITIPVRSLPVEISSNLHPFINKTRAINEDIIRSTFLNISASVVFVAVADTQLEAIRYPNIVLDICKAFGCSVTKLGYMSNPRKITILDDRTYKQQKKRFMSFAMYTPKFPLPLTQEIVDISCPPRTPVDPYQEQPQVPLKFEEIISAILQHPTTGSKDFIVKHIDRNGFTGRVARQQGVGPIDTPISDFSIMVTQPYTSPKTKSDYWDDDPFMNDYLVKTEETVSGICTALGEQNILFSFFPLNAAKIAIAESCLSLAMAPIESEYDIIVGLSISIPHDKDSQKHIVYLISECELFCEQAGIACNIDSCTSSQIMDNDFSAKTNMRSFVASAVASSPDIKTAISQDLKRADSFLIYLPASNVMHLFGSVLQQVKLSKKYFGSVCNICPKYLKKLLKTIIFLRKNNAILSGHDVSDGGTLTTLVEMACAGLVSLDIHVKQSEDILLFLASETPGVILQIPKKMFDSTKSYLRLKSVNFMTIGIVKSENYDMMLRIYHGSSIKFTETLENVRKMWCNYSIKSKKRGFFVTQSLLETPYLVPKTAYLTSDPYRLVGPVNMSHKVVVLMLPGMPIPEGLLTTLYESGFNAQLIPLTTLKEETLFDSDTMGICIVGCNNVSNTKLGDTLMSQLLSSVYKNPIFELLSRKNTFSLALGSMACEFMFSNNIIKCPGNNEEPIKCLENISKTFESRWLNFHIPENTKAIAFTTLKGSLIPCWAQGTHLGFTHAQKDVLETIAEHGQAASLFYGSTLSSGPAKNYPINPTCESPLAGICSDDGRHLALLHDPTSSYFLWQWQHIPESNIPITVSPWKQMLYNLHSWCISARK
ncbi:protein G3 [Vespertilionid gammaherpesvirus 1]|uniref:Protein G3 n=1 Tax=Vespertilionid gammaherpesvirus 1 TaxID=2560830 RepID=A0A0X9WQZ6_9GAMA|nr:protein G3 [Myotis gammaherpesvirus 8]AMA67364.1 protein G3 [Vespertilionid gammaherpesvirus 1]